MTKKHKVQSGDYMRNGDKEYISNQTAETVIKFRDERDWKQFHNPKDLAISISLEAAELLEIFQWSGEKTGIAGKEDKIKEELADIFNYCILMADACNLNADEIIKEKIYINSKKYPVNKSKGKSNKYNEL